MSVYYLNVLSDGTRVVTSFSGDTVAPVLAYKRWFTAGFNGSRVDNEHVLFRLDNTLWHGRTKGDNQICRCRPYKDQTFARRKLNHL